MAERKKLNWCTKCKTEWPFAGASTCPECGAERALRYNAVS